MNLILTVLEIVAPVFLLASVGFIWVKLGVEYRIRFVTQLAMTVSLPCLIFVSLMQTDIEASALATVSLAAVAAYAVITAVFALFVKLGKLESKTYLAPLIFGNTGNLGLPLAFFAFGETGLGFAVVIFAIMAIISFTVGVWMVSGDTSPTKVLTEPLAGASVLGGIFLWQGWQTPRFLTNTLELIGQMAIPLMLLTLGVAVARLTPGRLTRAFFLSIFKAIVCVGIAWVIGRWFDLGPVAFAALVLQIATPVAVTSYLLSEKYGADSDAVAGLVVVSTLLSVGFIPLLLAFLV